MFTYIKILLKDGELGDFGKIDDLRPGWAAMFVRNDALPGAPSFSFREGPIRHNSISRKYF